MQTSGHGHSCSQRFDQIFSVNTSVGDRLNDSLEFAFRRKYIASTTENRGRFLEVEGF